MTAAPGPRSLREAGVGSRPEEPSPPVAASAFPPIARLLHPIGPPDTILCGPTVRPSGRGVKAPPAAVSHLRHGIAIGAEMSG